ncbi:radical SAM superfamily protein, partial [Vibrio parahaemolyticus V-223/04]
TVWIRCLTFVMLV